MDFFSRRRLGVSLVLVFGLSAIAMAVDAFPPLVNWAAPTTYTPARSSGARTLGDITNVLPFIGVTPCRQFDIRPGTLADNTPLFITLTGAPCGLPAGVAQAVSLNITVFSISGAGANGVFKVGTANPPVTAWINYPPTETQRGNAGALPLVGGGIWVEVNQGGGSIQLTIDVNGYYPTGSSGQLLAPGQHMEIAGTTDPPFAMLDARNDSTTAGAMALLGIAGGASGATVGIFGENDSSTGGSVGVYGTATSAVQAPTYGVFGHTNAPAGANSAAGVRGSDGTGALTNAFWSSSGLLGQGENGILGYTSAGGGIAVIGAGLSTSGSAVATGFLGDEFLANHGVWAFLGDIGCSSCTKAFVDPHPTDPTKEIRFISLEGNEAGTYFRGTAETVGKEFVIQVPEDFRLVTDSDPDGLTVQLTPVGELATMTVVSEDLNQIVVRSSRDVKFHYLVQGIRATFKNVKTIVDMTDFLPQTPNGRMPEGWADLTKQRLIANGTYNKDGTINMQTAERAGWAQKWRDLEEQARAASAKAAAASTSQQ